MNSNGTLQLLHFYKAIASTRVNWDWHSFNSRIKCVMRIDLIKSMRKLVQMCCDRHTSTNIVCENDFATQRMAMGVWCVCLRVPKCVRNSYVVSLIFLVELRREKNAHTEWEWEREIQFSIHRVRLHKINMAFTYCHIWYNYSNLSGYIDYSLLWPPLV